MIPSTNEDFRPTYPVGLQAENVTNSASAPKYTPRSDLIEKIAAGTGSPTAVPLDSQAAYHIVLLVVMLLRFQTDRRTFLRLYLPVTTLARILLHRLSLKLYLSRIENNLKSWEKLEKKENLTGYL